MEESGSYYQSDRGDDGRQRDKHHKRKKEHSHSHNGKHHKHHHSHRHERINPPFLLSNEDAVGKYIGELRHWVKREKGKQLDDVDEEKLIKYVNKVCTITITCTLIFTPSFFDNLPPPTFFT
eukprot:m.30734 g.30734  ORF g.30734 m.30734 type:complete len:122 (-) comp6251_c0_seq2:760-1125(-)